MPDRPAGDLAVADLLEQSSLGVPGLYRRHAERNLSAIASAVMTAFDRSDGSGSGGSGSGGSGGSGSGSPLRLGRDRRLVVIAVDGLGFEHAARTLRPAALTALTSEFPTTTVACLLTSLTGQPTDAHGFIGVQYLHEDGLRAVNCHDGQLAAPTERAAARPTVTPAFPTIFDIASRAAVHTVAVPNEIGLLRHDLCGRMLHGAEVIVPAVPQPADLPARAEAFGAALSTGAAARPATLTWAYFDLDSHIHRDGFDQEVDDAAAVLGQLAARLSEGGATVLIYSDHGLTANHPSAETLRVWDEASGDRCCRLPAGGAGRVRWLYPRSGHGGRLAGLLSDGIPDAVVTDPDQIARWGLVRTGSIGQRRLGEIVLLARGPDFPAPDTTTAFEHGSMTADEVLVPMAIWYSGR